jgi:hypothetical protein
MGTGVPPPPLETTGGWRGLRSTICDEWGSWRMRGLGLNERDMDGANEFAGGKVYNTISRAIIALLNEHTTKRFW